MSSPLPPPAPYLPYPPSPHSPATAPSGPTPPTNWRSSGNTRSCESLTYEWPGMDYFCMHIASHNGLIRITAVSIPSGSPSLIPSLHSVLMLYCGVKTGNEASNNVVKTALLHTFLKYQWCILQCLPPSLPPSLPLSLPPSLPPSLSLVASSCPVTFRGRCVVPEEATPSRAPIRESESLRLGKPVV